MARESIESPEPPAELRDFELWANGCSPAWRTDPPFPGDPLERPQVWHRWRDARTVWADTNGWPGGRRQREFEETRVVEELGLSQAAVVEAFPPVETTGFSRWFSCAHCGEPIDYGGSGTGTKGLKVETGPDGQPIPSHVGCAGSTTWVGSGRRMGIW